MLELLLSIFYILGALFAWRAGYKKHWIIIALLLALGFQYVLHFSTFAQIIVAVIFGLYFVAPSLKNIQPPSGSTASHPQNSTASTQQSQNFADGTMNPQAQAVYEEFASMTGDGASKASRSKPRKSTGGKGRTKRSSEKLKSSRRGSRDRDEDPRRSSSPRGKSSRYKSESQKRLDEEKRRVAREKAKLKAETEAIRQAQAAEVKRLEAEKRRLAEERAKLQAEQQKVSAAPKPPADNRTAEDILGLSPGFTEQDLKDARKREVMRWNTSNMVNKPQQLKDYAEQEMRKINEAFDKLKRRFP